MRRPQLFGRTMYVDLLLSTLVVFTSLFLISAVIQKAERQKEEAALHTEGQFAVIMTWESDSEDDVDLYVRSPRGRFVFWRSVDNDLMHLEHDDQGKVGDALMSADGDVPEVQRNEERVILRGVIPGEYVVNAHLFRQRLPGNVPVRVRLVKLRGRDATYAEADFTFAATGDEQTAFRFTLTADKRVTDVNRLPMRFTGNGTDPQVQ